MEYNRYEFSHEAKSELLEFYKLAKKKQHKNPQIETWKKLLPKNEELVAELEGMLTDSVICISDDQSIKEIKQEKCDSFKLVGTNSTEYPSKPDKFNMEEVLESIKEQLYIEGSLDDKLLEELINLNENDLSLTFEAVGQNLDTELLYKFGESTLRLSPNHIKLTEMFIRYVIIPKLLLEYNSQINMVFTNILNRHLNLVSIELSRRLAGIGEYTKAINETIFRLSNTHKQALLKEFLSHVERLNGNHLQVIDNLITVNIDNESVQKLIQLLVAVSSTFSNDKTFGKLLLNLISNCKERLNHYEQQLTHIVNLHRSVWKSKLLKCLNENVESNSMLSQTQYY